MIFDDKFVRNYGNASIDKVTIPTNQGDNFKKQVTISKNKTFLWENA
jgi:hypothetical protein